MARIRYKAQLALDPDTGLPNVALRGASGFIYLEGTTTQVTLYAGPDVGDLVVPQPITVSSAGFLPQFWIEDPATDVEFASGTAPRSPLESTTGLKEVAVAAAASAAQSAQDAADALAASLKVVAVPAGSPTTGYPPSTLIVVYPNTIV